MSSKTAKHIGGIRDHDQAKHKSTYPYYHCSRSVHGSDLEIGTLGDVVEKEVQDEVRLFLLESHDTPCETLIHVERFLSCDWMFSD